MRILHVYKTYYTESFGGVEQFIRQLGMKHAAMGHDVSVLTLTRDKHAPREIMQDGVRVLRYPLTCEIASNGFSIEAMKNFRSIASQADILHYHYPWPSGDVLHQFAPAKIPAVVTYHSDIVRQKLLKYAYAPLMRLFLAQMDAITTTSPNYIQSSKILQGYLGKTTAIPIGLDEQSYPTPTDAEMDAARAKYGENFFLIIGVIRYYKGLHTLIQAAANTGLPVIIAGSGPQEDELKKMAADLNAPVRFIGRVNDQEKMPLLKLCRAFAFPSHQRSEAFGISLLEAAMMGKPLISCEIGTGMSYINQNNETGYIVPPDNAEAFGEAMQKIIADPARAAEMGNAARARFEAIFTAEKMAKDYEALYTRLISKRS